MFPNHIVHTTSKAREFLNRDLENGNEFQEAVDLLLTLSIPKSDQEAAKRFVRLLLPAVKRFVWTWDALGCDLPGPTPAIAAVAQWLETGEYSKLLTDACTPCVPIRDRTGSRVNLFVFTWNREML